MKQRKGIYQNWMGILVLLFLVVVMGILIAGCAGGGENAGESEGTLSPQRQAQEENVKDITNPSELYTSNCGPCHGHDGSGIVGPSIKGTSLSVEEIQKTIENGKGSEMPGFKGGGLSEAQIKMVAKYVKEQLK